MTQQQSSDITVFGRFGDLTPGEVTFGKKAERGWVIYTLCELLVPTHE